MYFRLLIIFFLVTTFAFAQGGSSPKGGESIYVVKSGDTLSSISNRFFGNPLLWPRLWELNPYIDNPNRIYPGNVIALMPSQPDLPVVKINPETKVQEIVDVMPPRPIYYYSLGGSEGFISPDEWEHMGVILTSETPKIILYDGDKVFTNLGTHHGVKPGDKFTVFRTSKQVLHPIRGTRVGYKVAILGELEIRHILGKRKSSAIITQSFREITRGAKIRPHRPFVKEVSIKKGQRETYGYVIDTKNPVQFGSQGSIVYIDRGSEHSVVAGNTFSIYTHGRRIKDPDSGKEVKLPGILIGKMVVLDVTENSSTGIITESSRQIEMGSPVSLDL